MLRSLVFIALAALLTSGAATAASEVSPAPTGAASAPGAQAPAEVSFAIIRTGGSHTREAVTFSGGSFSKKVGGVWSAFLVKHNGKLVLLDSGLGSKMAEQFDTDMPSWGKPLFRYEEEGPVVPARKQLDAAGMPPIEHIVLTHAHWDHASGLVDFPGAEIGVSEEEMASVRQAKSSMGKPWPSQVGSKDLKWKILQFQPVPYEGFERSLDMYGDGSVVLVPMYGHTPGSVGMFVKVTSGKRYFFVGDVVWNAGALAEGRPKLWPVRKMVDHDDMQTQAAIDRIRAVMKRNPGLVVVPSHDGGVQDTLGYFPAWVR